MKLAFVVASVFAAFFSVGGHAKEPAKFDVVVNVSPFDGSSRDSEITASGLKAVILGTLQKGNIVPAEVQSSNKSAWLQFDIDYLYVAPPANTRVIVMNMRAMMAGGKEVCGATMKTWWAGPSGPQALRQAIQENVAKFDKACKLT